MYSNNSPHPILPSSSALLPPQPPTPTNTPLTKKKKKKTHFPHLNFPTSPPHHVLTTIATVPRHIRTNLPPPHLFIAYPRTNHFTTPTPQPYPAATVQYILQYPPCSHCLTNSSSHLSLSTTTHQNHIAILTERGKPRHASVTLTKSNRTTRPPE